MGMRTAAERDAETVEIVYAFGTAALLAAAVGGASLVLTLALGLPTAAPKAGGVLAAAVFAARTVGVLTAPRRARARGRA
ncbi:DUF6332 family protein, partial [Streptomyces fuscigenes]|uniref:DUF6332 family protein n=1 Tax=Streptomyces fuscigenes TaxID=1528880 RepID=UPI001F2D6CA5